MSKNKLYGLLLTACAGGYIWLAFAYSDEESNLHACLFKTATGIPCPSCGVTRAILLMIHGDVAAAIAMNPLGIIVMLMMFFAPLWIIYDLLNKKDTFLRAYVYTEHVLRKKSILLPAIVLMFGNWIWNIYKGL